ncbi:MAG: LysM peptidoglycan-binding domain-containing protein [Anaerolineae bacterium]|nr:LysM peptidoglycan-binding domain-containing protein [Anaerolineae bacterium]
MNPLRRVRLIVLVILALTLFLPVVSYAQGGTKHVVQQGENLYRIALQYGVTVQQIAAANGIYDVSQIYVGQELIIPGAGDGTTTVAVQEEPAQQAVASTSSEGSYYTVQRGDTLKSIAAKFNVTWQQIVQANSLANPNVIYVGQKLYIPGASAAQTGDTGTSSSTTTNTTTASAGQRTHVVQAGEGLSQIGQKYGVPWTSIAAANNLSNPNLIYAGMVLIIPDASVAAADYVPAPPTAPSSNGKLILVVLSEQRVYAYENGELLRNVLVSTGLPGTPTVVGEYNIYVKYQAQLMTGPGYYLPNVPYVMYFYRGYGLHGTYWHNNFGHPMSHGCVNLPTPEAEWFYNWAPVGTRVLVRW